MSRARRSCYDLEVTHEDIDARIAALTDPTDADIAPKTSQFVRRKRNSYKSHLTLSDRDAKYYSCGSVRAQLGNLAKK